MVEPWLRGTLTDVDAVRRGVLHALELAREDVARWCGPLTGEQLEARVFGLPSVGFHLRHMVRSLDRLLTYAEGQQLSAAQIDSMKAEMEGLGSRDDLFAEFAHGMESAAARVRAIAPTTYEEARGVGRKMMPTSVGGLLVHCADHTQRHVGQAVTTAKLVVQVD